MNVVPENRNRLDDITREDDCSISEEDSLHARMFWLFVRSVRAHVEVAWNFVDLENGFHSASFAVIDINFRCVLDETDFVSTQVVLDVETKVYKNQINNDQTKQMVK